MAYQTSQQQKEIKVNRYTHFQGRQFCENGFSEKRDFSKRKEGANILLLEYSPF